MALLMHTQWQLCRQGCCSTLTLESGIQLLAQFIMMSLIIASKEMFCEKSIKKVWGAIAMEHTEL